MGEYTLSDKFMASGKDLDEFKAIVDDMAKRTEFVRVPSRTIGIFAYHQEAERENGQPIVRFWRLSEHAIDMFNRYGAVTEEENAVPGLAKLNPTSPYPMRGRFNVLGKTAGNAELLEELKENTGLLVKINGEPVLTSPGFRKRIAEWSGAGAAAGEDISLASTTFLAKRFKAVKRDYTVVIRYWADASGETHKKAFGLLSDKYAKVGNPVLHKAIDLLVREASLGKIEVARWSVTQDYAEIFCEFPDAADSFTTAYGLPRKIVPGLRLASSDTGWSSVIVEPTYRIDDGMAIGEEVRRVHRGEITEEMILQEVNSNVLKKLHEFPEALCERMAVTIGSEDLTTKEGRKNNKRLVYKALTAGMQELGINKVLGLKRMKLLREKLKSEIRDDLQYTEFDIAMILMNIPDRIQMNSTEILRRLSKCCGNAASIPYYDLAVAAKSDEEDIYIADAEEEVA